MFHGLSTCSKHYPIVNQLIILSFVNDGFLNLKEHIFQLFHFLLINACTCTLFADLTQFIFSWKIYNEYCVQRCTHIVVVSRSVKDAIDKICRSNYVFILIYVTHLMYKPSLIFHFFIYLSSIFIIWLYLIFAFIITLNVTTSVPLQRTGN